MLVDTEVSLSLMQGKVFNNTKIAESLSTWKNKLKKELR
jgi:hypothetical protein